MKTLNSILILIALAAVSIYAVTFTGCSNSITNSGTPPKTYQARTEKDFADRNLKAEPGAVIVINLEDLHSKLDPEEFDTDLIGVDIIPYTFTETAEHKISIGDSSYFTITLINEASKVVIYELSPANNHTTVTIPAGDYLLVITSLEEFGLDSLGSQTVFIQPGMETDLNNGGGQGQIDNPGLVNFLLRTRRCPNCNLRGADLYNANLSFVNLDGANLSYANLRYAILTRANMNNTNLFKAQMVGATLSYARIQAADLSYANLTWAKLNHASCGGSNFFWAVLREAKADSSDFRQTNMKSSNISSASFQNANFFQAKFHIAELNRTNLSYANMSFAFFKQASLSHTNLNHADLSDANFNDANLKGSNLKYADLRGAYFCGAEKAGLNSEGAIINNLTICFP